MEYLQPHLLGVVAYFNITLIRVDVFESSSFSLGVLVSPFIVGHMYGAFVMFIGIREFNRVNGIDGTDANHSS